MKKEILDDNLLREAARRVVEDEFLKIDAEVKKSPHTFSPEFYEKMNRLLESARTATVHRSSEHRTAETSQTSGRPQSFLKELNRQQQSGEQPQRLSSFWRHRRYIAAAALLMAGISAAALANDDIRQSLQQQLKIEFFSDNVTIEAAPETDTGQTTDEQTETPASNEFHAYKWKEAPEGYEVVYEEEDATFKDYVINYENDNGGYIYYFQSNTENSQHHITYDPQEGYKRTIELSDGLEAYSISDGRNNTIFYEKNGYLFGFMSDQPEEVIIDYINFSGVLEYGN